MIRPPLRSLYSLGWLLGSPLAAGYLLWRSMRQPDYRRHWGERLGRHRRRESTAPLIWIHAVSVGETRAAQPLVDALAKRFPQAEFLLTHMTPTGRETSAALFGNRVASAYLPYDHPWAVRGFLDAWRPSVGVLMETELWPNLVAVCAERGVPLAALNVRLSQRSLERGRRWGALIADAVRGLSLVLAQSADDARRIEQIGGRVDAVTGNLKFDIAPAPAQVALGRRWRQERLRGRPAVLAASTRDGEEALLLDAWQAASSPVPSTGRPLLVIVPRHPQRFDAVATMVADRRLRLARRDAFDDPGFDAASVDVVLGDAMGEMFAWYACADVAIIGGSLLPFGSQNLIEACAVGCPVLIGPSRYNFAEAAAGAIDAGAAVGVDDAATAVAEALSLAADAPRRRAVAAAGASFSQRHRGATERSIAALAPLIERAFADAASRAP